MATNKVINPQTAVLREFTVWGDDGITYDDCSAREGDMADEIVKLRDREQRLLRVIYDLAHEPDCLDPDSSTVTPMMGVTGKQLRRAIGWSYDEQAAWLAARAAEEAHCE